ncbi:MAG: ribonuclease HII [Oscillospiraceae bacterium]|nr:ribonuclease HII [Oscillospiraceae bacterium]
MKTQETNHDLYEYDAQIKKQEDISLICGVDEAGRGPLAGDVFAAAVILGDAKIEGINDSKKLTAKKRDLLYDEIIAKADCYCIARATVDEIEHINILRAAMLAMKRAVEGLEKTPQLVLVDGNTSPDLSVKLKCVVKGDALSANIAAASVLAKVSRDRYMEEMAQKYPQYLFEKHKGYGTKLHYAKLDEYGPSEIHRPSFLRKYNEHKADR